MRHIFVSYSRQDSHLVDEIVAKLEGDGLDVWIDREDMVAGRQWRGQIVAAIENSDSFVLMLSPYSAASKYVRQEVFVADDRDRFLVSTHLQSTEVPQELALPLAGLQRIEYYKNPDYGYSQLESTLRQQRTVVAQLAAPTVRRNRQAELAIEDVEPEEYQEEKRKGLLALLALLLGIRVETMNISSVGLGKVFVRLPTEAAYELKAQGLNGDQRLIDAGISELRLDGDNNFVQLVPAVSLALAAAGSQLAQEVSIKPPKVKSRLKSCFQLGCLGIIAAAVLGGLLWGLISGQDPVDPTPTPRPSVTEVFSPTNTPRPSATKTDTPTPTRTHTPTPTLTLTPPPPNAPSNLQLECITGSSLLISWNDNATNEDGYRVYLDNILIASLDANITSYLYSDPVGTYSVEAYNDAGSSLRIQTTNGGCVD